MPQYLLDTDLLTLFDHGQPIVAQHVAKQSSGIVGLTAVTVEEYLRGRLARIAQAQDGSERISRYGRLLQSLQLFEHFPIAAFDQPAEDQYQRLRALRLRIGSRDEKIAAIALAINAVLATRNRRDFGQVPGLVLVDWSV